MTLNKISDLEAKGAIVDDELLIEVEQTNLTERQRSRKIQLDELRIETQRRPSSAKSADYTITGRDDTHVVLMTTGASDRTVSLPDSSTDDLQEGDEFEVYKVDAGAGKLTLAPQGTDTIDGETAIDCDSQYDFAKVRYLGSGLYVLIEYKDHGYDGAGSYWERKLDGSMLQRGQVAALGTGYSTGNYNIGTYGWSIYYASSTITFPKPFIDDQSEVTIDPATDVSGRVWWGAANTVSETGAGVTLFYPTTNVDDQDWRWHAHGRWR